MKSLELLWGLPGARAGDQGGSSPQDSPALPAPGHTGWGQWGQTRAFPVHPQAFQSIPRCSCAGDTCQPQNHCCPQPAHFTEISFLLVELELRKQRGHPAPALWQSLTQVAAPSPTPQGSFWEAEALTLPTALPGTQTSPGGAGQGVTQPPPSPRLPLSSRRAAETAPRELSSLFLRGPRVGATPKPPRSPQAPEHRGCSTAGKRRRCSGLWE